MKDSESLFADRMEHPGRTTHNVRSLHLPTGTVTFLFTDIQGSVPLWERASQEMADALEIHNTVLRHAIEANGGIVFKTVGDAFQAAFTTAQQALNAAIEGQRGLRAAKWNELGELRVRMGLHTGEAELDPGGDEYAVSHTKNRVGRIHSVAYGGQILVSEETADLVKRNLPERVALKDLGEHRLKGMEWLEHLFQVCAPGLDAGFPPLATAIAHPNNLPIHLTSFIGRENEIDYVCDLISEHRLVTLTGSGGTGKTRLSLQVASHVLENYPNGAWLVELASLVDPFLVPKSVASALSLPETPGKNILDSLVDFLRPKRLLLILDNCEHLLAACTSLADLLLRFCPMLTILASSREILGVKGEVSYRVPPMALPDARHLPPVDALREFGAVRLFIERARLVSPAFALTESNASAVVQVVTRLDGIPLAIELAAARSRLLSVEQIALRLNDAFRLLTGGSRAVLPRHQTLRALIDWSYTLLTDPERRLLRRLSIFGGSWTLEAAEMVCLDEGEVPGALRTEDILDLMGDLVDKSLVQTINSADGLNRFTMLETIRQYAHEKLVDEREAGIVRARHMHYYSQLVDELSSKIRSREQIETLDRLELELSNLRLALEWALQMDVETELKIAAALKWLWHIHTHYDEGIGWLERGLESEQTSRGGKPLVGQRALSRANALCVLGFHLKMQLSFNNEYGLVDRIRNCLKESLALFEENGGEVSSGYAWAVLILGDEKTTNQTPTQAQKSLDIFRKVHEPHGIVEALWGLAVCEIDPGIQRKYHQEAFLVDQANGDVEGVATALYLLGQVDRQEGDWDSASKKLVESLSYYKQVRNLIMVGTELIFLCLFTVYRGDLAHARQYAEDYLVNIAELGGESDLSTYWLLRSWMEMCEGLYEKVFESVEKSWRISQKIGNRYNAVYLLAYRARLHRLQGEAALAQRLVNEGLAICRELSYTDINLLVELGHQALENQDLGAAAAYWREGLQTMIRFISFMPWPDYFDASALLAAQLGKQEQAVRIFSSRWCRGYYNALSPRERTNRDTTLKEIGNILGDEAYIRLCKEGEDLTFMQMLEAVKGLLGLE